MATKTITKVRIDSRRVRVSELYLSGLSQREIATELGIPRTTVQSDLNAIRLDWRAKTLRSYEERINIELSKIDQLENIAWAAWDNSVLNTHKKIVKTRRLKENTVQVIETTEIYGSTSGDEVFLKRVAWCIDVRCKILGFDRVNDHLTFMPAMGPHEPIPDDMNKTGSEPTSRVNTIDKFTEEQLKAIEMMAKAFPK